MSDAKRDAVDLGQTAGALMGHHVPHCGRLGMEVLHTAGTTARVRLPWNPELVGDPVRGVVFGGAITTLLDHASGIAVFLSLDEIVAVATLDLRIDYLRAAEPGFDLIGESTCYKRTANVAFVRATAWEHTPDDPFASCLATFMLTAGPGDANAIRAAVRGGSPA